MGILRAVVETKYLTMVHIAVILGDVKHLLDGKLTALCPLHSERGGSFSPWIFAPILGTVLLYPPSLTHSVSITIFRTCGMFYLQACNPT